MFLNPGLIAVFIFILLYIERRNKTIITQKIINKKKGKKEMIEFAKRFIDKECLIYILTSSSVQQGIIKEVSDGAILVESGDNVQIINLDYEQRIQEHPRNKKGKKKAIIFD